MGAIHFSLDQEFVDFAVKQLELNTFVESGTFRGDTSFAVKEKFKEIHSIELSEDLYKDAVKRFEPYPQIKMYRGDSGQVLKQIMKSADFSQKRAFFWLDAHWCEASAVSGYAAQCPLLAELEAIGSLNETSLLLIDDARLFLAPPNGHDRYSAQHWPRLQQVLNALASLSRKHEVVVSNDVIFFFPEKIRDEIFDYLAAKGCDWLTIADKARDYDNFPKVLDKFRAERDEDARQRERFYTDKMVEMQLGFLGHLRALDADKKIAKNWLAEILPAKVMRRLAAKEKPAVVPAEPMISILVPLLGEEVLPQLSDFLLSIQVQDYKNIEVVVLDVTPGTQAKEICTTFTKSDTRFKYYKELISEFDDVANLALFRSSGYFFFCAFPDKKMSSTKAISTLVSQFSDLRRGGERLVAVIGDNLFARNEKVSPETRTNLALRGDEQFFSQQAAVVFVRQSVYDVGGFGPLAKGRELEFLYLQFLRRNFRIGRIRV